ncbi:MAG: hypothetical protein HC876_13095, partial [Chloroflexaceae bacterium]|nr:hypothetical protein [Chloroflexaceae bacterium]
MPPEHVWQPTATPPVLHPAAVHVWWATLAPPTAHRTALAALLSPDEQQRAARFVFPQHQQHFTVARGLLRLLIGRYLSTSPAALRFTYSSHGKPALLQTDPALPDLRLMCRIRTGRHCMPSAWGARWASTWNRSAPMLPTWNWQSCFFAPAEAAALHPP